MPGPSSQLCMETLNAPIFGIDRLGLVNEWNAKTVEITGFTKEEVMGLDLLGLVTSDFREEVKVMLQETLEGKVADGSNGFVFPLFNKRVRPRRPARATLRTRAPAAHMPREAPSARGACPRGACPPERRASASSCCSR